ncbi:hypothetical protein JXI42_09255 [bacterium]|nr:hypothetical protein [bacterium]
MKVYNFKINLLFPELVTLLLIFSFSVSFASDTGKAIEAGVDYLYNQQMPSGEFPTYISESPGFTDYQPYTPVSPYITSYILYTFSYFKDSSDYYQNEKLKEMTRKGLDFLRSIAIPPGLWRFEPSLALDIDNTSCALLPFILNNMNLWDYDAVFEAIENNSDESGLLLTFFRNNDKKQPLKADYDISVYSNMLLLYGLSGKTHQPTLNWLNDNITSKWKTELPFEINKWAVEPFTPAYLVSRAYNAGEIDELKPSVEKIEKWLTEYLESSELDDNPQHTALILLTLINFDYDLPNMSKYVNRLLDSQNENGSWLPATFFMDFKPNYYGSPALSTALCLVLLLRYENMK